MTLVISKFTKDCDLRRSLNLTEPFRYKSTSSRRHPALQRKHPSGWQAKACLLFPDHHTVFAQSALELQNKQEHRLRSAKEVGFEINPFKMKWVRNHFVLLWSHVLLTRYWRSRKSCLLGKWPNGCRQLQVDAEERHRWFSIRWKLYSSVTIYW